MFFLRDQDATIVRLTPLRSCIVVTRLDRNPKSRGIVDVPACEIKAGHSPSRVVSGRTKCWEETQHNVVIHKMAHKLDMMLEGDSSSTP
jgi:hypothetical protein